MSEKIFTELVDEMNKIPLLYITGLVNNIQFLEDIITNADLIGNVDKIIRTGKILRLNSAIIDEYNRIIVSYVYNYPMYLKDEYIIFIYNYNKIIIDLKGGTRSIIKITDNLSKAIINSEEGVKKTTYIELKKELKEVAAPNAVQKFTKHVKELNEEEARRRGKGNKKTKKKKKKKKKKSSKKK